MLKTKKPGLAIVETILVIAISGLLFVVVIGLFASRRRTQSDDGARQVLSIIAKVRNEAQTGKGPSTQEGKNLLKCNDSTALTCSSSNEIFGQAIKFYTNPKGTISYIQVMKLMQNTSSELISAYESERIDMPGGLLLFAPGGGTAPVDCSGFSSCYSGSLDGSINYQPLDTGKLLQSSGETLALVFRNRTGESYAFSFLTYADLTTGEPTVTAKCGATTYKCTPAPNPVGAWKIYNDADSISTYAPDSNGTRQGKLRLAMVAPGSGSNLTNRVNSATAMYYINFDLSVPNNQNLEVVK